MRQGDPAGPRVPARRRLVAALVALGAALAGCTSPSPEVSRADDLAWRDVTPPAARAGERLAFRDATFCAGRWVVVGAALRADGTSRPAVWSRLEGRDWQEVPVRATGFYARQAILSSVGCRRGRLAAVGDKSGGAHGLPRVTTFRQRGDGALVAEPAAVELFGGPSAVSVNRVGGGDLGWLITGARTSGASVWVSEDATDFALVAGAPGLSSDARVTTTALDQVDDGHGWTVVGSGGRPDGSRLPLAWVSRDGRTWQRQDVEPAGSYSTLERVAVAGSELVAVGLAGDAFGVWRRTDAGWRADGSFGSVAERSGGAPFVASLTTAGVQALATVTDGAEFQLWAADADRWTRLTVPANPTNAGDHTLVVAAHDEQVLLLEDDAASPRVWQASLGDR